MTKKQQDKIIFTTKFRIGKLLIRSGTFDKSDANMYLKTILLGFGCLIFLPLIALRWVFLAIPKFTWFSGSKQELDDLFIDRDTRREQSKNFANFLK